MRVVALLLVGACHYAAPGGGSSTGDDAPTDEVGAADGTIDQMPGPTPTACVQKWLDHTVTFNGTAAVQGNNFPTTSDERDVFVSKDELVIYFAKIGQNADTDIFFASRITKNQPFGDFALKTSLSKNNDEDAKVAVAGDDKTAVMVSDRGGGSGGFDLWLATRDTTGIDQFDTVNQDHLGALNTAGDEQDPFLMDDGLELYWSAGTPQNILRSTRATTTADFGTPQEVGVINGADGDADPSLTADGRVILFTSNRAATTNGTNIWYATRDERFHPFGAPVELLDVNSGFSDGDPHITTDGCTVYWASNRLTDFDLFETELQ